MGVHICESKSKLGAHFIQQYYTTFTVTPKSVIITDKKKLHPNFIHQNITDEATPCDFGEFFGEWQYYQVINTPKLKLVLLFLKC